MKIGCKILIGAGILSLISCGSRSSSSKPEEPALPAFTLPVAPTILSGQTERTAYLAEYYWQGLDYADTAWLANPAVLEQIFVQWIALLEQQPVAEGAEVTGNVISLGNGHPAMQLRLAELAEHYFHNPNSPCRNEEFYIPILRAIIAAPDMEDIYKERPRYQLEKALMNRPGTRAADFAFVTRSRQMLRLSDIQSDYVLLYFFNPDCHDCKRVATYMTGSSVLSDLSAKSRLTVLAVYPDKDLQAWEKYVYDVPDEWIVARYADDDARRAYDLPAIPNLYLLDREKDVVLKDAPVEKIEDWLKGEI